MCLIDWPFNSFHSSYNFYYVFLLIYRFCNRQLIYKNIRFPIFNMLNIWHYQYRQYITNIHYYQNHLVCYIAGLIRFSYAFSLSSKYLPFLFIGSVFTCSDTCASKLCQRNWQWSGHSGNSKTSEWHCINCALVVLSTP